MKKVLTILSTLLLLLALGTPVASAAEGEGGESGSINPKEIIFEHLGDGYGWEVPFSHSHRIPLPVIVRDYEGGWHVFSSARLMHGGEYDGFKIAEGGEYNGKVVGMQPDGNGGMTEYRPLDLSITKNVAALWISALVVALMAFWLVRWYKRNGMKAPRKGLGAFEVTVAYIYDGVIKPTLGTKAKKFAPYLLTVFFFILTMNLLGLIVIFPGGANLTGNLAVTLVLSIFTFLLTNLFGTKHYWKDIFWPDVPWWLKVPIPMMPIIELFGVFTKPAALTVRLFPNMMGGHMIVIVLTLLIFIFTAIGGLAIGGLTTVVSLAFSLFMLLIDTLVSFIQAYVFTMLSTRFISLAQAGGEHGGEAVAEAKDSTGMLRAE